MRVFLPALLVVTLTACTVDGMAGDPSGDGDGDDGGGGGDGGGGSGGGVVPGDHDDDPPADDGDPQQPACPAGAIGSVMELKDLQATFDPSDPDDPDSPAVRTLSGRFGVVDSIEVQLFDGYGAFAESQAAPGSYPISGDDADPATCGVCVYLYLTVGEEEHSFLATSGLVELESVDDNLTGSATALDFDELEDLYTLDPDGCSASISDVAFDAALQSP
jgi:hypothetical protein